MANINIHVRSSQANTVKVAGGADKNFLALRMDWLGGDEIALFFEDEEQLFAFEEKVSTAVRAFQQSRSITDNNEDGTCDLEIK